MSCTMPISAPLTSSLLLLEASYGGAEPYLYLALARLANVCARASITTYFELSGSLASQVDIKVDKYGQFTLRLPFVANDTITRVEVVLSARCLPTPVHGTFVNSASGTGVTGSVGPCVTGATGARGATGTQGPAGLAGLAGPRGADGPLGVQGVQGAVGPTGIAVFGPTGPPGPIDGVKLTGATGPQGPDGLALAPGPQGPAGPLGATGGRGPPGVALATGATGATGASDQTGPQGPPGVAGGLGAAGPVGPKGATGLPGPTGMSDTGPRGADAQVLCSPLSGIVETSTPFLVCDGAAIQVRNIANAGGLIHCGTASPDEIVIVSGTAFTRRTIPHATAPANVLQPTDRILVCRSNLFTLPSNARNIVSQSPGMTINVPNNTLLALNWSGSNVFPQRNPGGYVGPAYFIPRRGYYSFTLSVFADISGGAWTTGTFLRVRLQDLLAAVTVAETRIEWEPFTALPQPPRRSATLRWVGLCEMGRPYEPQVEGNYNELVPNSVFTTVQGSYFTVEQLF